MNRRRDFVLLQKIGDPEGNSAVGTFKYHLVLDKAIFPRNTEFTPKLV
jgi:hypothetical protein